MTTLSPPVAPTDHAIGPADAPRVLVEYGDLECVHCRRAFPVIQRVRAQLGDQLRFVFRHFPVTNVHPHAQRAAETAEWAASHGKFWEAHDYLYRHPDELDDAGLLRAASALGLDRGELALSWRDHRFLPRVKLDFTSGLASGVTGTPGFFIDGERYDGPWDGDDLLHALTR